ncbi:MAG: beta-glucosidase, partial [Candidatus Corynebacterium faecigallinarum]
MSHTTPDTAASESATALPAASLPLETRAGLGSGQNFWQTKEADGVPSFTLTDGSHGLRKQEGSSDHLGLAGSVKATCF